MWNNYCLHLKEILYVRYILIKTFKRKRISFQYSQFLFQIVKKESVLLKGSQVYSASEVATFKNKILVLETIHVTLRINFNYNE